MTIVIAGTDDTNATTALSLDDVTYVNKSGPLSFGAGAIRCITFGGGTFVAGGGDPDLGGLLATSPDLTTWTAQSASWAPEGVSALTYDGTKFLAGGASGSFATSPDGVTWTSQSIGFTFWDVNTVWWNGPTYIVGGNNGNLSTSADGFTWTLQAGAATTFGTNPILGLAFGAGLWVAVGQGTIATSNDLGVTWTSRTIPGGLFSSNFKSVAFGNSVFVATSDQGDTITSPNGVTWTAQTGPYAGGIIQQVVCDLANTLFVQFGATANVATSPDGITWTTRTAATNFAIGAMFAAVTFATGSGTPIGVSATASAGTLKPTVAVSLAGVAVTATAGAVRTIPTQATATGVSATATAGTPSAALQAFFTGVFGTAQAGALAGANAILIGNGVNASAGTVTVDITRGGTSIWRGPAAKRSVYKKVRARPEPPKPTLPSLPPLPPPPRGQVETRGFPALPQADTGPPLSAQEIADAEDTRDAIAAVLAAFKSGQL
jgi:hypothetical protein